MIEKLDKKWASNEELTKKVNELVKGYDELQQKKETAKKKALIEEYRAKFGA